MKIIDFLYRSKPNLLITSLISILVSWFFLPVALSMVQDPTTVANITFGWVFLILAIAIFGFGVISAIWLPIKSLLERKWLWLVASLLPIGCYVAFVLIKLI